MMFRLVWTFLKGCFTFFSIVGAMFMTVWLMYEYTSDKDVSSVNFKYFHENKDNIYPSITMCFGDDNQFNPMKGVNTSDYINFLSGCEESPFKGTGVNCSWNASLADLDYDAMTRNWMEYVIGEKTEFKDNRKMNFIYSLYPELGTKIGPEETTIYGYKGIHNGTNRVYISSRKSYQKCLTFDMPFIKNEKILYHSILLNNTIFDNQKRPIKKDFEIFFHYPNQTSRKTASKFLWESEIFPTSCSTRMSEDECAYFKKSYTSTFEVDQVQVSKNRNKPKAMCIENWKNDDVELRTLISEELKCQPTHWKLGLSLTKCVTRNDMSMAAKLEYFPKTPSCKSMERYSFLYTEKPGLRMFKIAEKDEWKNMFNIDWESEAMKNQKVSEINIHFIGKINSCNAL